jgi:ribosomal protein L35AE/L33A
MAEKHAKEHAKAPAKHELDGVVAGFAMARRHQDANAAIVTIRKVDTREAASKLLGHTVVWKGPEGLTIRGRVHAVHGNGGAVIARFRRQLPPGAFPLHVKVHA